ncbi:Serine/threonine-protein kinase ULK1 [Labeo rohita]|uniref:non-specific serine/threonine protein kinase n=1 Tax=Labeo rohita TaxID=84645 RepID=A0ABQ8LNL7_LABRO|nr:Serine/threonine-protein kinase ULK1 [Labeo rohita]
MKEERGICMERLPMARRSGVQLSNSLVQTEENREAERGYLWEMETVGKFEFSRKDLIGHGAFAVVFKGRHREKHDWEVAVKCINKKNLAKSQTLLGKEIKILKELKHENIVALHDFQETASSVYLVMEVSGPVFPVSFVVDLVCLVPDATPPCQLSEKLHGKAMEPLGSPSVYCNGGDLADYLHYTIRVFLQQITGAMRVLQAKGIIHRDLKPQNILLSHPAGRKSHSNNTCIKIGAPEVIMSQNYDAKADLWSIGTIASSPQDLRLFYEKNKTLSPNIPRETSSHLRHLLLGLLQRNHKDRMDFDEFFRHPFLEASSSMKKSAPVTVTCFPNSASASSCSSSSTSHLASPPQSLAEIQQVRAKALASPTQDSPGYLLKDSGGGGGGSSSKNSSCDTDDFVMVPAHFPSELTCDMPTGKVLQDSLMYSGSSLLASGGQCSQGKTPPRSPSYSSSPGPSGPSEFSGSNYGNYGQSIPIPVPTQIHNYQRMEQNLQFPGLARSRGVAAGAFWPVEGQGLLLLSLALLSLPAGCLQEARNPSSSLHRWAQFLSCQAKFAQRVQKWVTEALGVEVRPQQQGLGTRLNSAPCLLEAAGGCRQKIRKQHSDPVVAPQGNMMPFRTLHSSPRLSELMQRNPLPTILGSPSRAMPPFEFPKPPSSPNMVTFLTHQGLRPAQGEAGLSPAYQSEEKKGFGRSQSAGRLSDVLLMAAFGGQRGERGSMENLNSDRAIDITAPPGGGGFVVGSGSPARVVFTVGSLTSRYPQTGICMDGYEGPSSPRYGFNDPISAVTFEAPELPEETLMEQEHTETLRRLRFMLDFARCMVEVAGARSGEAAQADLSSTSLLQQQSLVADQISSLSREWSYAEQLVLYMKIAELLSSSLHTAMEGIKQGKLYPSTTVKQVVRRLNDLYKSSVMSCRSLSAQLERFFSRKHKLMDHINSITAERLLFSHTVQMVQTAALDEMFHQGEASIQRYHKALLLMEGLSLLLTDQADILSVSKQTMHRTPSHRLAVGSLCVKPFHHAAVTSRSQFLPPATFSSNVERDAKIRMCCHFPSSQTQKDRIIPVSSQDETCFHNYPLTEFKCSTNMFLSALVGSHRKWLRAINGLCNFEDYAAFVVLFKLHKIKSVFNPSNVNRRLWPLDVS